MAIGMLRTIIQRVPQLRISLMATPLVQSVNSRWPFPVRLSADFSPKQVAPRKFGPVSNGFGAALPSRPTNTLQNHKDQNRPPGKRILRSKRILAGRLLQPCSSQSASATSTVTFRNDENLNAERRYSMNRVGILATLQARPGREIKGEEFLKSAPPLVAVE